MIMKDITNKILSKDNPEGWKMTTLGEAAEIIMGQSPSG